jgi:hypothetical protein
MKTLLLQGTMVDDFVMTRRGQGLIDELTGRLANGYCGISNFHPSLATAVLAPSTRFWSIGVVPFENLFRGTIDTVIQSIGEHEVEVHIDLALQRRSRGVNGPLMWLVPDRCFNELVDVLDCLFSGQFCWYRYFVLSVYGRIGTFILICLPPKCSRIVRSSSRHISVARCYEIFAILVFSLSTDISSVCLCLFSAFN